MSLPCAASKYERNHIRSAWAAALAVYVASTMLVLCGAWVGSNYLPRQEHRFYQMLSWPSDAQPEVFRSLAAWDGFWYARIARDGYAYDSENPSPVAFFPAYPLLTRAVSRMTGCTVESALLTITHVSLAGSFALLVLYSANRYPGASGDLTEFVLLATALWPTTVFFRMAYSESLFILLLLAAMYGMVREWPAPVIAVIIGAATATRPVGVALLAPFALWLWQTTTLTRARQLLRAAVLLPLACWGIVGYMVWQHIEFGDALAFARTQQHFVVRPTPFLEKAPALLTLEPLWSVFVPSSPVHWTLREAVENPLLSLQFANPIYFGLAVLLLVLGSWKGWLDSRETLLGALLLLIPYVSLGYDNAMWSQGRFAAVVFPAYLVLGQSACRVGWAARGIAFLVCVCLLFTYSALFAAWYRIF